MAHYCTGDHLCDMEKKSISGLPTLSPRANVFTKISRFLSRGRLPTHYHCQAVKLYKSEKSLIEERRRLISEAPWYVIHPFSLMALLRDFVISHTFIVDLFVSNILNSFDATPDTLFVFDVMAFLNTMCSVLYFVNAIISMTMGYVIDDSQEIELRPRRVVVRYLKSYALLDFILIVPFTALLKQTHAMIVAKVTFVACCFRFKSFLPYIKMTLSKLYRVSDTYMDFMLGMLVTFTIQHCCTCFSASLWKSFPRSYLENRNTTTLYDIFAKPNTFTWMEQYAGHYLIVFCHLEYAGRGRYGILAPEECVFYAILMFIGIYTKLFGASIGWALVRGKNKSEIRYHNAVAQFADFAARKGVSGRLRYRIMAYLKQKHRGNVFNEQVFKSCLSEHLQHEIKLQSCLHLLRTMSIFKGISMSVLGEFIATLETVSFIPGEVIFSANDQINNVFIISRGTVAVYTERGIEVHHLHDSDMLGDVGFFDDSHHFTVVAVEFTDMFYIPRDELMNILDKLPELKERMVSNAQKKYDLYHERLTKSTATYRAVCNVYEILEQRQLRKSLD